MPTRSGLSYSPSIESKPDLDSDSTQTFVFNSRDDLFNTLRIMLTLGEKLDTQSRRVVLHAIYTNIILGNLKLIAETRPAYKRFRRVIYKKLDEFSETDPTFHQYKRKLKQAYAKLGVGKW